uniref:Ig-like domain-containing protein n=1 Tax=Sinocyclocheilus rhinocerous TaxID=307959 RepID=A0A673MQ44_9TELE
MKSKHSNYLYSERTRSSAENHIPKPTLTVEPQSSLFTGDSVTLRCEVDQSWDGWEFLWCKNSNTESTEAAIKTIDSVKVSDGGEYRYGSNSVFSDQQEHTFSPVTESDTGKYSCYGAERGGSPTSNIGDEVTLTVGEFDHRLHTHTLYMLLNE